MPDAWKGPAEGFGKRNGLFLTNNALPLPRRSDPGRRQRKGADHVFTKIERPALRAMQRVRPDKGGCAA
jgi:hypothetical protein